MLKFYRLILDVRRKMLIIISFGTQSSGMREKTKFLKICFSAAILQSHKKFLFNVA